MYWQTIRASQRLKKLSLNSKFFDEFLEFFNSASVYFDVRWQFFSTRVHTQSYRFLPCSPLFNLKQQQQQQQQRQQHKFALHQIYVRVVAAFQRGKFCYSPSYGIARLGRAAAAQDTPSSASGHSRASVAFKFELARTSRQAEIARLAGGKNPTRSTLGQVFSDERLEPQLIQKLLAPSTPSLPSRRRDNQRL